MVECTFWYGYVEAKLMTVTVAELVANTWLDIDARF